MWKNKIIIYKMGKSCCQNFRPLIPCPILLPDNIGSINKSTNTYIANDGAVLTYIERGVRNQQVLLMLPGWSQSAQEFYKQYDDPKLNTRYHVIALNPRGFNTPLVNGNPTNGYKIDRLAADVYGFMKVMNLNNIIALGHSMGCSVWWNFIQNYGTSLIKKFIFVDQSSWLIENPLWTPTQKLEYGSLFNTTPADPLNIYTVYNTLKSPIGNDYRAAFDISFFTPNYPVTNPVEFNFVVEQNKRFYKDYAADLIFDHIMRDWSTLLPKINKPSFVIGGAISLVPFQSQLWNASQIPNSQVYIFTAEELGSHFMWYENPTLFNQKIIDFIST
jgi:non-heme chloroperoxidase